MKLRLLIAAIGVGVAAARAGNGLIVSPEMIITPVSLPSLPLGLVSLPSGKALNLTVSPGAGAFRGGGDPPGRIWTITDRGPSIDCSEEKEALGPHDKQICLAGKRGKIHLLPGYVPSIYAIEVGTSSAKFVDMIPLKTAGGKPVNGLAMPLSNARTENSYAVDGRQLAADTASVEPGGLVRLGDGSFWIADSAGPSLLEVGPDGTVRRRLVPANLADDLGGADYAVEPVLPAILSRRQIGHGFDGIAVSPDERFLYVAMQNALAHPDIETYRGSALVRLFKLDRISGQIVARYLYQTDAIADLPADSGSAGRPLRQSDVRVMELAMTTDDRLLVLERTRSVARVYLVDLNQASELPQSFEDEAVRPSLEQMPPQALADQRVTPLAKRLLFRTDGQSYMGARLSGLAVLNPRELVLVSNNDFGIEGGRTQMFRLTFAAPILN